MLRNYLLLILIFTSKIMFAQNFDWFDESKSQQERINALINSLTIEEKISQLMNSTPAIDRLKVKEYDWWNECLHGVARNGRATVFPQAICLAATFDEDLTFRVATAISDEARAKFNIAQKLENYSRYSGLTFWSPNVNLFRDPRWGRGQETYGEDPFLTSRIGVNFIKGLQGNDPKYLKTSACAKHYVVHSGPEEFRHEFNAIASPKDIWETYLPAFEAAVKEADVESIMGAYNRTNGEACCASELLLTDILRKQWGFNGHIVSDCGAIHDIWTTHGLTETPEEASALSLKSGLDLNCGETFSSLKLSLEKGLVKESDLDTALYRLFRTRIKLGMFDSEESNPYNKISPDVVNCEKHVELSREEARKGMVLLKNKNNVLPLKKDIKNLYVTGPHAANADILLGNYYGVTPNTVNFLDGITSKISIGTTLNYKYGQMPYGENINPMDWTTGEAAGADACIAVMGISGMYEGEEGEAITSDFKGDKRNIRLPKAQIDFLKKIRENGDNPLIVVLTGGSPIAIPEVYELADAVIFAWYPGEQGGNALADLIFGDYSPSGRMPFTVPYSVKDLPDYSNYDMKGRTYRYMTKKAQFPFGFGLTYTDFEFENLILDKEKIKKGDDLEFSFKLKNTGNFDAEEVVQAYIVQDMGMENQPLASLKAFKRIPLKAKNSTQVKMTIKANDLRLVLENGERTWVKGKYKLIVGNASPSGRSEELGAKFIETSFSIK